MNVSHTELQDILKKVFEGQRFSLGDYEDCAHDVAWLELHGWPVLDKLLGDTPLPPSRGARFLYEDASLAVLDAQNNGGLIYGSLALELAMLKAAQQPTGTVRLINAHLPELILPSLSHCAANGFNCFLSWQDDENRFWVSIAKQDALPTVQIQPHELKQTDASVMIICGTAVSFPLSSPAPSTTEITPADFLQKAAVYLNNGIPIEDAHWETLVDLSKNILVEATESSRQKGAGENAS